VKLVLAGALVCGAVLLADAPRIGRAAMSQLEGQVDKLFAGGSTFIIEGNTRGVYLDGYGAVFTTMLSVPSKVPTPFNDFSKKDILAVRETKLKALPALRDRMQQSLLAMASSPALDSVRPGEQVVCGVTLFYYSWEDTHGLPREILMQAEKQKLLGVQNGRVPKTELASFLKVQEQ
jgi:hypothetical protein